MTNNKYIFAAACLGLLLFGIVMTSLGSILPEIVTKFELSGMEAGVLASILPFGILVGSFLFGPLVDRYGYKWLLFFFCALVMIGLEGIAFATSWGMMQIALFLIGVGGGALNGATNALVADISEENKGAKLSSLGVFFGIGALGMPVCLSALSEQLTQEQIIAGIGASIVLILVYILLLTFPQPKHKQGFPIREGIKLLANPVMLLLSLILFCQSGLEGIVNNWSTSYLQSELKVDTNQGLFALTIYVAALTIMRFFLGSLLKRFPPFLVLGIGIGMMALGALTIWQGSTYEIVLAGYIMMGIGFAGVFPIVLGQIGDLWPDVSGTAFSIALVIALIGNILINSLMGILSEYAGIQTLPLLLIGTVVLFAIATFFAYKQLPQ